MKYSAFWIWTIVPSAMSALAVGFFGINNFQSARAMRADSRNLSTATDQYLVQRNELDQLQADLTDLHTQRDLNGHALRSDVNESKLIPSLTRPIDGTDVFDQAIRIGERTPMSVRTAGLMIDHRAIEMQMTGSFNAVFAAVHTAEGERGMTRVRSVDMQRNGTQLQASVGIDEFFHGVEEKK